MRPEYKSGLLRRKEDALMRSDIFVREKKNAVMHKLGNVQKTCLPEAVYLVDFEDRELRVSEFNIHLFLEGVRRENCCLLGGVFS